MRLHDIDGDTSTKKVKLWPKKAGSLYLSLVQLSHYQHSPQITRTTLPNTCHQSCVSPTMCFLMPLYNTCKVHKKEALEMLNLQWFEVFFCKGYNLWIMINGIKFSPLKADILNMPNLKFHNRFNLASLSGSPKSNLFMRVEDHDNPEILTRRGVGWPGTNNSLVLDYTNFDNWYK